MSKVRFPSEGCLDSLSNKELAEAIRSFIEKRRELLRLDLESTEVSDSDLEQARVALDEVNACCAISKEASLPTSVLDFLESAQKILQGFLDVKSSRTQTGEGASSASEVNESVTRKETELAEKLEKLRKQKKDQAALRRIKEMQNEIAKIEAELQPSKTEQAPASVGVVAGESKSRTTTVHDGFSQNQIATLAQILGASKLAPLEPSTFSGDPTVFLEWEAKFDGLIESQPLSDQQKFMYLEKYVEGEAKQALGGHCFLKTGSAYKEARETLRSRFGESLVVSRAYTSKLDKWPKVKDGDSKGLQEFSDFLNQCLSAERCLPGLGVLSSERENLRLVSKLPEWLSRKWGKVVAEHANQGRYPDFEVFVSMIQKEAQVAKHVAIFEEQLKGKVPNQRSKEVSHRSVLATTSVDNVKVSKECVLCQMRGHTTDHCRRLAKFTHQEYVKFVQENGLCFGCLGQGHTKANCKDGSSCKACGKKHPFCRHDDWVRYQERLKEGVTQEDNGARTATSISHQGSMKHASEDMSAMIVPVWIETGSKEKGKESALTYALLDSQSDTTFITDQLADQLTDKGKDTTLKLATMTSKGKFIQCRKYNKIKVQDYAKEATIEISAAFTRDSIPINRNHIPTPGKAAQWNHLEKVARHLQPKFDCEVGLLIGYDCSRALKPLEVVSEGDEQPYAVRTTLGWSMVGGGSQQGTSHFISKKVQPRIQDKSKVVYAHRVAKLTECPNCEPGKFLKVLEQDFAGEDSGIGKMISREDKQFLSKLDEGFSVDPEGYCTMPLPFRVKPGPNKSDEMAKRRFWNLEKKLEKNPMSKRQYNEFMNGILGRGEAEEVPSSEMNKEAWYAPHFGVYHPKKPGKIRVVFDCSAATEGKSLNDFLLPGPDLMNSLLGILLRFRVGPIAVMLDVEKMFHQFRVSPEDRDFLRFWWYNKQGKVTPHRMKVHAFGVTSSPGCATYGLRRLAEMCTERSPAAVKAKDFIKRNFYVDDGILSTSTAEEASAIVSKAREICSQGNVRLHKLASNSKEVLKLFPPTEIASELQSLNLDAEPLPGTKTLGMAWNPDDDSFNLMVALEDRPHTRRGILSTVASLYDPLGLVSPCVLEGKRIFQEICKEKTSWDDPISEQMSLRWEKWKASLQGLHELEIPRCVDPLDFPVVKRELHHFSDASTEGYGQCTYLRSVGRGQVHVALLMSKSRVAPLKTKTIPRLELQAAITSVKVSMMLREELHYENSPEEHFWTDSKVVLGYVQNPSKRFHVYVANKVQYIQDHTEVSRWRYVASKENPADLTSRGSVPDKLRDFPWLHGPKFLWEIDPTFPEPQSFEVSDRDEEVKKVTLATQRQGEILVDKVRNLSSWHSAISLAKVFLEAARKKKGKDKLSELDSRIEAERELIRQAQNQDFEEEIKALKGNTQVSGSLKKLTPFLDEKGLLRVGGRMQYADSGVLSFREKHPIILSKESWVSELIISYRHDKTCHQGRGMTMAAVRQAGYWVIGLNKMVASMIHNCVMCKKIRGKTASQMMAPLPKERLEATAPFTFCGVDCFGPIMVKAGRKEIKRYGILFTCLASRAVHIDVLEDMSSDAFINAFNRFRAIRGPVRVLMSDQGTNFMGAHSQLAESHSLIKIKETLAREECDFKTTPATASHMGGVWERQIQTAKKVLKGILSKYPGRISDRTLQTVLFEVMSIINSRPLGVETLSDESSFPITPNLLLTQKSNVVPHVAEKFGEAYVYGKARWKQTQALANLFWNRWRSEYLNSLQQRQKWNKNQPNFEIGDIVLLKENNLFRGSWSMGRIIDLKTSRDDLVRSVHLQLASSHLSKKGLRLKEPTVIERPVTSLVLLLRNNVC